MKNKKKIPVFDFEIEEKTRSPGWLRYLKKIK